MSKRLKELGLFVSDEEWKEIESQQTVRLDSLFKGGGRNHTKEKLTAHNQKAKGEDEQ